jgi:hypothetical protein
MSRPGWYNGKSAGAAHVIPVHGETTFVCRNTSNADCRIILSTLSDSFISVSQPLHSLDERPLN